MSSRTWTIAALACCAACGQDAGSSQSDGKRSAITTPAGTSHRIDVTVEGPRGVPVFSIPRGIHCAAPGSGPTYGGATDRCSADFPVGTRVILEMDIGTFGIAGTVEGCTGMSDPQRCEVDTDLNTHVTFRLHPAAEEQPDGQPQHILTVAVDGPMGPAHIVSYPPGIRCPGACSAEFASGTIVTLDTADLPQGASVVIDSVVGCTNAASCRFALQRDRHVGWWFESYTAPPPGL